MPICEELMGHHPFSGGKIKIGYQGEVTTSAKGNDFRLPKKIDHFLITKNERGEDGNYIIDEGFMNFLKSPNGGGIVNDAGNLVGIPIRLMYNDINRNFPHMLARFVSKKCACSGDGKKAFLEIDQKEIDCPCDKLTKNECKFTGSLSVMIDGPSFHGHDLFGLCHTFRTAGKASVDEIKRSLQLVLDLTMGQQLSFLPLMMIISPFWTSHGISYLVAIRPRVGIDELIKLTTETASKQTAFMIQMQKHENKQGAIEYRPFGDADDQREFADEFHPGQVEQDTVVEAETEPAKEEAPPEEIVLEVPAESGTETEMILPLAVDEFKNLKQTGLREFVFENGDRIAAAPYHIAAELFDKWGRIMGTERCPDDLWNSEHSKRYIRETSKPKTPADIPGKIEPIPETQTPTIDISEDLKPKTEPAKVEAPAGEKIPFGGKAETIKAIYKDCLIEDTNTWRTVFASMGLVVGDTEIQTVLKDPKSWNDLEAWKAVLKRTNPEADLFICDISCKNQESRGAFARWHSALADLEVEKAGDLDTIQAKTFIRLNEIPF